MVKPEMEHPKSEIKKNIRFCLEGAKSEMEHPKSEIIKILNVT